MSDEEMEDWPDQDGSDNQEEPEGQVLIQNTFYEAEGNIKSDPALALEQYENVILLEEQEGGEVNYRFKSWVHIILLSAQLGKYDNMISKHKTLLKNLNKVSPNEGSEAINNILDSIPSLLKGQPDYQRQIYQYTLESLKGINVNLWFNMSIKLGKTYLENAFYEHLESLLTELKNNCKIPNDPINYDPSKGNQLLEAFALEIQLCIALKNNKRMKQVYSQTTNLNAVINDPKVIGIIKESGGKMFMSEKKWDRALEELFESFKNYQESGDFRAKVVLKYVILASILSGTQINYADTREAKVYQDDPQIIAIIQLRQAFDNNDINLIQQILSDKRNQILDDPFINTYLEDLLRNIRLKVLAARVRPYKSISLEYLSKSLDISKEDVRSLLSELILEEKIKGEIDQLNGYFESVGGEDVMSQKYVAMRNWAKSMTQFQHRLVNKF